MFIRERTNHTLPKQRVKQIWPTSLLLILSTGSIVGSAQADYIASTPSQVINGRAPTASGNLTILLPDGTTTLADYEPVLNTARPNEFTLGALDSGLIVQDSDDDAPLSLAIATPGVEWIWKTPNGTILTAVQLTQPFSTRFSVGDVLTVIASAPVESISVTGIPSSGIETYTSQLYRVKLIAPPTLQVNGANFSLAAVTEGGFPKTGFADASFQYHMNGINATDNTNYTYHVNTLSQDWVNVSPTGVVTFTGTPTSANNTVTITAEEAGKTVLSHQFTLGTWFVNGGSTSGVASAADAYCLGLEGGGYAVPSYSQMTDAALGTGGKRQTTGKLWSEWGSMAAFGGGWVNNFSWALEPNEVGRYAVNLGSGGLGSGPVLNRLYTVCSRDL